MKHKILKLPAVLEKVGCGKSSIYRKLSEGDFPTPIKLGERSVGWVEAEVDAWIESKSNSLGGSLETKHPAEETLSEQKIQNQSVPESLSLRAYFMANITPPVHLSDKWATELAGPLPRDELGCIATTNEKILQLANAEAEYKRIFADAMIRALTK